MNLSVVLEQAAALSGRVKRIGEPIPHLLVEAWSVADADSCITRIGEAKTGDDGRFRIRGLKSGKYELRLRDSKYVLASSSPFFAYARLESGNEGEITVDVRLADPPPPAFKRSQLRVRAADGTNVLQASTRVFGGEPLLEVEVEFEGEAEGAFRHPEDVDEFWVEVTFPETEADGTPLAAGLYGPAPVEAGVLTITLDGLAQRINGTALEGERRPGLELEIWTRHEQEALQACIARVRTDDSGHFTAPGLKRAKYEVRVSEGHSLVREEEFVFWTLSPDEEGASVTRKFRLRPAAPIPETRQDAMPGAGGARHATPGRGEEGRPLSEETIPAASEPRSVTLLVGCTPSGEPVSRGRIMVCGAHR